MTVPPAEPPRDANPSGDPRFGASPWELEDCGDRAYDEES